MIPKGCLKSFDSALQNLYSQIIVTTMNNEVNGNYDELKMMRKVGAGGYLTIFKGKIEKKTGSTE